MPNYVPGTGNPNAKLVIVGEAPGEDEDYKLIPFVGASGKVLDSILHDVGVAREEVWLTNVIKYRPPDNDLKRLGEIGIVLSDQIAKLWVELDQIRPWTILALGNIALRACAGVDGIGNYRGSILPSVKGNSPKVIGAFHPVNVIRQKGSELPDYRLRATMLFDFERAVKQSKFKDYRPPTRILRVCRDAGMLYDFLKRYNSYDKMAVDIETARCVPICIGLAFTRTEGISIPFLDIQSPTNPRGITYSQLITMWKMIAVEMRKRKIIGQNYKFDDVKLENLGFDGELYSDTMIKFNTLYPDFPQSLAFIASLYTEEPYYKNEREDYDPAHRDFEKLLLYNAKDACVTLECDEEMEDDIRDEGLYEYYYQFRMRLHNLYKRLETEGWRIDEDIRYILQLRYSTWFRALEIQVSNQAGHDVNINSPKQMSKLLYEEQGCPVREGTNEKVLVALLNNAIKDDFRKTLIDDILKGRKVSKTSGTYLSADLDYDGRMRTSYRITGTETGRTSTSLLKAPVRPDTIGLAFQTLTKHGDVGTDLRRMFIADDGYIILECDSAQAEDRVVCLLANDEDGLQQYANGIDRHKWTAALCTGMKYESVDKMTRYVFKRVRHAGNYDMGKYECMQVINKDAYKYNLDIQISEYKAGKYLEKFHFTNPKIRGVYHAEVREALQRDNRVLRTPFGHRRQFHDRWGPELFKQAYAQIPQSTVADNTKRAMLYSSDHLQGLRIIVESHDSFTCMIKPNEQSEVMKVINEEMTRGIDFSRCSLPRGTLSIPCEFQAGTNWRDLTEVKC